MVPHVALSDAAAVRSRPPLPDSLAGMRTRAVVELIREIAPRSVIDFGCGHGWLLAELAADVGVDRLTGIDFSSDAIAAARRRIGRASSPSGTADIELREGMLTYRDPQYLGHDVAAAIEVIEHLDVPQLGKRSGNHRLPALI